MENSSEGRRDTAQRVLAWSVIGLLGIIGVIVGIHARLPSSERLGEIVCGLGLSFVAAASFQIMTAITTRATNGWYNQHRVEIFAPHRREGLYSKENAKIAESLNLMCVSANAALKDLQPPAKAKEAREGGRPLYEAFARGANIQILIVDPTCPAMIEQATTENLGNVQKALEMLHANFNKIEGLHRVHELQAKETRNGSISIRLMPSLPRLTLYVRDSTVIFGPYLTNFRGDDCVSIRLEEEWNPTVFRQFAKYFDSAWTKAERDEVLLVNRERTSLGHLFTHKRSEIAAMLETTPCGPPRT